MVRRLAGGIAIDHLEVRRVDDRNITAQLIWNVDARRQIRYARRDAPLRVLPDIDCEAGRGGWLALRILRAEEIPADQAERYLALRPRGLRVIFEPGALEILHTRRACADRLIELVADGEAELCQPAVGLPVGAETAADAAIRFVEAEFAGFAIRAAVRDLECELLLSDQP